MTQERHHSSKSAKVLLVVIFFMLRVPDAFYLYFSFDPVHPVPALRGSILIGILWTTVFLVAIWMRKRWARYLLILFTGYVSLIFMLVFGSVLLEGGVVPGPAIATTALYLGATVIVIRSKSLRRLAQQS